MGKTFSLPTCCVSTAGIQFGEMERRRTSSLPPSQVPCCDDCLSRCLCYAKFCGPICGPPIFDVCMSPVDLRLRQLKGQEKKWGAGAVHASRSGSSADGSAKEMQDSESNMYSYEEEYESNDIVYMPSQHLENEQRYYIENQQKLSRGNRNDSVREDDSGSECDENSPKCSFDGSDKGSDNEIGESTFHHQAYGDADSNLNDIIESIRSKDNYIFNQSSLEEFHGVGAVIDLERVQNDDDDDQVSNVSSTAVSTATPTPSSSSISSDDDVSEASSTRSSSSIVNYYAEFNREQTFKIPDIDSQPRDQNPSRRSHRRFPSSGSVNAFSRLEE